ncbi:MAG TPA: cell wall-binding repeat-containing protein [Coriobacteriia bacterium]|jgi:photosystem II stability/assembly factor-like uncharacterized protein
MPDVVRRRPFVAALLVLIAVAASGCATLRSSGAGGAGGVWLWDNPRMAGNDLRAVAFSDGREGWAVGAHGTILHTTNAGEGDTVGTPPFTGLKVLRTRTEFSGTKAALNGVGIAVPGSVVWAVGDGGTILRTVNDGQTWLPVESYTGYRLNDVAALDAGQAWTVGDHGTIRSWNGTLWAWQSSGTTNELLAVDFVSPSAGFAAGRGRTLLKTTNGGANWMSLGTTLPASADIRSVSFSSVTTGYAATWDGIEGALWRTGDGGASWAKVFGAAGTPLDSVTASGPAEVWATGANGFAFHTDGSSASTGTLCAEELRGTCVAGGTAWAVGSRGRVFAWSGSWTEKSSIVTLERLRGYSAVGGWAVGDGGTVIRWSDPFGNRPSVVSVPTTADLTAAAFTDGATGWVTASGGTVLRVTGGSVSGTSGVAVAPTSIAATDAAAVWLCGNLGADGYVLRSTDGGSSWTTATSVPNTHLFGISVRGGRVYVVGGRSTGSHDGVAAVFDGSVWSQRTWAGGRTLRGVWAISPNAVVAVGDLGCVMRSSNGGASWTAVPLSGPAADLNAVSFAGASDGRAAGDGGTIFATSDGGATWTVQDSGTSDDLLAVDVSSGTRRAVGARGCILAEARVAVRQLAGSTRYDTALEVSRNTWGAGEATTVVLATGENWPDAVCGSSLAGAVDGPVLLTRRTSLPGGLVGEMKRLGATKAYVLGSTRVIDPVVVNALKAQMGAGFSAERIGGADRYESCALIAGATVREIAARGGTFHHSAFLATGLNWPDALAVGPVSSHAKEPVFLTRPTGLPASVAAACRNLEVTSGVVVGSFKVVPEAVADEFGSVIGTAPARWSGPTRYETASEIASGGIAEKGLSDSPLAFATGWDFPDALAGGVAQGHLGGALLLTPPNALAPAAGTFLWERRPSALTFIGGVNVLPQRPRDEAVWVLTSGF